MCCLRGVLPATSRIWREADGNIVDKICVYFYNDPPKGYIFCRAQLKNDRIIELVNSYWNCSAVRDKDGREIGKHVPSFEKVDEAIKAHVRVEFLDCKCSDC